MSIRLSILICLTVLSLQGRIFMIIDESKANEVFRSNYKTIIENEANTNSNLKHDLKGNELNPFISEVSFLAYNKDSSELSLSRTKVVTFTFKELKGILSISLPNQESKFSATFEISALKCNYSTDKYLNTVIYNRPEFRLKLSSLLYAGRDFKTKRSIEDSLKKEIKTVKRAIFDAILNSIAEQFKSVSKIPEIQFNKDIKYSITSLNYLNVNKVGFSLKVLLSNEGKEVPLFDKSTLKITETQPNSAYLEQNMLSQFLFYFIRKNIFVIDTRETEFTKFVNFDILETVFPAISDSFSPENEVNAKIEVIDLKSTYMSGIKLSNSLFSANIITKLMFFIDSKEIYSFKIQLNVQTEAKIKSSTLKIKNLKLKADKIEVLNKFTSEEDSELSDSIKLLLKTAHPFIFSSINNQKIFEDLDFDAEIEESHVLFKLN